MRKLGIGICCLLAAGVLLRLVGADPPAEERKVRAYEFAAQKDFTNAITEFRAYLQQRPNDIQAAVDFAGVLSDARQHAEAAKVLETIHRRHPGNEPAYFKLGAELVYLGRSADALKIFTELQQSSNRDLAEAAADSLRALQKMISREERFKAEQEVFTLADKLEHENVIAAVDALEKTGPITFALAMQRLYAMDSLREYAPALERATALAILYPSAPDLTLLRADLLAQLGRRLEAIALWKRVELQNAGTPSAIEASKRRRATEQWIDAQHVYQLAREQKQREVITAIDAIEKQRGELPWSLEMQRLFALQAVGDIQRALDKANALSKKDPDAADLKLMRGYLLAAAGQKEDAKALLARIQKESPGTATAESAWKQLEAFTAKEPPSPEAKIYELASKQRYRETVESIDELERKGPLSFPMMMQRLYALQALGDYRRAEIEARRAGELHPRTAELALIRADLLIQNRHWEDASLVLKQIRFEQPDSPAAIEAERRLDALPLKANLDKWYWGEAYNSGDYMGRFGTVVGSGFLRHGYFVPLARWLQPYGELRYAVDTRSERGQRTIVSDNFIGGYLGARAQPFASEYLFGYIQAGVNKDFLDRRHDGDPRFDYQGGVYGFKSWGPGTVLLTRAPDEAIRTSGTSSLPAEERATASSGKAQPTLFWRGDWFADGGADFSYYHRYSSWIGYGQAHEGFRLFQIGPHAGVDAYAVENVSWDVRGNYFDNLAEVGPGARLLWVPRRRWEVILRLEWLNGYYFGRNELNNRGEADSHYDDFRAGLSVGTRW